MHFKIYHSMRYLAKYVENFHNYGLDSEARILANRTTVFISSARRRAVPKASSITPRDTKYLLST